MRIMFVGENTFIGSGFAAQGSKILEALSKKHEVPFTSLV
jgi:hypothetical protein